MTNARAAEVQPHTTISRTSLVSARLFVGLIVLVGAEGLSGASIRTGLWHPWTLLVTYWLYFAHFFFFTTLAIRTRKTSLPALYLWGVLFGLYETWITKVVWAGFEGNGHFTLGKIGPYGFAEINMVFFFHPLLSFLLPLCVLTVLSPGCRRMFPELAGLMRDTRKARMLRVYLVVMYVTVLSLISGGPLNIAINIVVVAAAGWVLLRFGENALKDKPAESLLVLRPRGFAVVCVYLAFLYGLTYFYLRPGALPSAAVQFATFIFYAAAILSLMRVPAVVPQAAPPMDPAERSRGTRMLMTILVCALLLSLLSGSPILAIATVPHFVLWTLIGFVLFGYAVVKCVMGRSQPSGVPALIR
ncbi:MAG: hypothetical protein IT366_09705 [Candidatus Hydrogenedentes bacterium]|nr:hypothetical protein [Candidatus Hydrogenedentota bacterium]